MVDRCDRKGTGDIFMVVFENRVIVTWYVIDRIITPSKYLRSVNMLLYMAKRIWG